MNMLFRCASRLIAVGALTVILATLASASSAEQTATFKVAMGPTSAAQKNQGPPATASSDALEPKPHHHIKHHRRHHHRR